MPREISPALTPLLGLDGCYTQTTVSLYPVSGSPVHMATDKFSFGGIDYVSDVIGVDEIRQSIGVATDRLSGQIQNVTKTFGQLVTGETLTKAVAVVGRYFRHPSDAALEAWQELFRGEFIPLEINDGAVRMEVLHDLVAAGYCVGHWSLAENCQFVYKHLGTCGFAGAIPTCNKKRQSPLGCAGKIVTGTTTNEFRFGGMEFPEPQSSTPPGGGGGGGGIGGGDGGGSGWPTCPQLDQWVMVRGRGYKPVPKHVGELTDTDELYHPIWKTFHEVDALTVCRDQPIWAIETDNGGRGFSSFTHPVLWYREHANGVAVSKFLAGDPILTWSNDLADAVCTFSDDLDELGDVMKIEMVDGHIYCYSNKPEGPYIVCHNAKPVEQWEQFPVY